MSDHKIQFELTKVTPAYWRLIFDNPPIDMLDPSQRGDFELNCGDRLGEI